jgi:hypothetical protein
MLMNRLPMGLMQRFWSPIRGSILPVSLPTPSPSNLRGVPVLVQGWIMSVMEDRLLEEDEEAREDEEGECGGVREPMEE